MAPDAARAVLWEASGHCSSSLEGTERPGVMQCGALWLLLPIEQVAQSQLLAEFVLQICFPKFETTIINGIFYIQMKISCFSWKMSLSNDVGHTFSHGNKLLGLSLLSVLLQSVANSSHFTCLSEIVYWRDEKSGSPKSEVPIAAPLLIPP